MPEPQVIDATYLSRLTGVLRLLENTSDLRGKRSILLSKAMDMPELKSVLLYALDPYRKYGIQQFPSPLEVKSAPKTMASWYDIVEFLNNCRLIWSGNVRIEELHKLIRKLDSNDRELLRRIVLKDLRCGVGATLVNSVFEQLIPEFGVMLASPLEERHLKAWQHNKVKLYGQPKENGDRLIVMVNRDFKVESYTRNGHICHNYRHIESSLSMICQQSQVFTTFREGVVFDGEVIHGDFWGTRGVKKLPGNNATNAMYHAFDLVGLEEWRKNTSSKFSIRNFNLKRMSNEPMFQQRDNVAKVPTFVLGEYTMDSMDAYRDTLVKQRKEGLIIRPDLLYNYKTRSSLFKHKKVETGDFTIVEVLAGEKGKKHEHHAGRIVVELEDGVTCKAGLSLSDAERDALWERRNEVVGMVAEVEYAEMTQSKTGPPKLWHPVFKRIREDKS